MGGLCELRRSDRGDRRYRAAAIDRAAIDVHEHPVVLIRRVTRLIFPAAGSTHRHSLICIRREDANLFSEFLSIAGREVEPGDAVVYGLAERADTRRNDRRPLRDGLSRPPVRRIPRRPLAT